MFDSAYLISAAERFGDMYTVEQFDSFVATAGSKELAALRLVHDEIERREDLAKIADWAVECRNNREADPSAFRLSCRVLQLFVLFDTLADSGMQPFTSRLVLPRIRKLDWGILPASLSYLAAYGEWFAKLTRGCGGGDLRSSITSDDRIRLNELASKIARQADLPRIYDWVASHPLHLCEEAWVIYSLIGLLDELDLSLE